MTSSREDVEAFLSTMANQGCVIVKEAPKFDLESYIQNYSRVTRFDRLLLIGQCSAPLCLEALKAALTLAKNGKDVSRYREVWGYLRTAAPDSPEAQFDKTWVSKTEMANKVETKRLEHELKSYKNNLVKESIRMGHEELGKHLEATGDLHAAAESYNRMRPDVSTAKHITDVGKHVVRVSVLRREWGSAQAQLNKISGIQGSEQEQAIKPYLHAMSGLAMMGQSKYEAAAQQFLSVDGAAAVGDLTGGLLTTNDVAVYGGLLALATMNRAELQSRVLENSGFRPFLELEPHIRRAISQFVNGRYTACLAILTSYRADYMLDLFLHKHVQGLYEQIRSKCITQYLIPFSCVTLDSMNAAFCEAGESIEEELVTMIRAGLLNARIDSINKLVVKARENPRARMQKEGLDTITRFNQEAIDRVRRMNLMAAELDVKGTSRRDRAGVPGMTENWFESRTVE